MITISNAFPLISLSAIGLLDLLRSLYGAIHLPEAVYEEVAIRGSGRTGAQQVASADWIVRHAFADQQAVNDFRNTTKLQRGEAEAILLAMELGATVILPDDAPARKVALDSNFIVTGTVGVLLTAKDNQLIASVKRAMDDLKVAGAYIHPSLYNEILRRAGERKPAVAAPRFTPQATTYEL